MTEEINPNQPVLIYDWNTARREGRASKAAFQIVDETLRDGIQSPSVRDPELQQKTELVHLMARCGVDVVNVGLPGASSRALEDAAELVKAIRRDGLDIVPHCAARTHSADIDAVAEVAERAGETVEACTFVPSSPIRQLIEGWELDFVVELVRKAGQRCRRRGLPFTFVLEDTTRSAPRAIAALLHAAMDEGATRAVLCDTAGHATPDGLRNLLSFVRGVTAAYGVELQLDWHGHNDRGLALTLALEALHQGVDRIHATCLGVGERVGNTSLDQLLINLKLLGFVERDVTSLAAYVRYASSALGVPIPRDYPVFGRDAFRTATGVHAAAVSKALAAGRERLADQVFSSVPASLFGCEQEIAIGYYSGRANAVHWLRRHGIPITDERVRAILAAAKKAREVLTDDQVREALAAAGAGLGGRPRSPSHRPDLGTFHSRDSHPD